MLAPIRLGNATASLQLRCQPRRKEKHPHSTQPHPRPYEAGAWCATIFPDNTFRGANLIEQQQGEVRYMQFSHYLQFPEITHGSFTRLGGYSKTPYWGLNVSYSIGDDFENVLRNRLRALQALHIETYPCATLWLIHGAEVATLSTDAWDDWGTDWAHRSYQVDRHELIWTTKPRRKADAIITRQRGVALGSQPRNIYACLGPSIGSCCYEVTEEVQRLFLGKKEFDTLPTDVKYRNLVRESAVFVVRHLPDHNSLRLDLWETNRNQLLMAGVLREHIELPGVCTSCEKTRFFSHRGEHGKAGRFPSILALGNETG